MKLVLIVDDNESVASALAIAFARIPGVEAVTTHHPSPALRMLTEQRCEENLAAIVTDFNLPELDGLELIKQVRATARYESLPAILITADESLTGANGCILNTPNAIFRKPFSIREVCRVLEELLT